MNRLLSSLFFALLGAMFWASGCSPTPQPAEAEQTATAALSEQSASKSVAEVPDDAAQVSDEALSMIRVVGGKVEHIDPAMITALHDANLSPEFFVRAYVPGQGTEPYRLQAAVSHDVSEDKLTHTLVFREDLEWSDGVKIVADDFRWSILRSLDPDTQAQAVDTLNVIVGAKEYMQGKGSLEDVGVRVGDTPLTLVLTFTTPKAHVPYIMSQAIATPVPRHVVEKHGKQWTRPEHIVTSGPYLLTSFIPGNKMTGEKNPRYFDAASVQIDRFEYRFEDSSSNAMILYDLGKVHLVTSNLIPNVKIKQMLTDRPSDFLMYEMAGTYMYLFRTDKMPFDDVRVRRAFDLAIDKEQLVINTLGGVPRLTNHFTPDHVGPLAKSGYTAPAGREFDPEEAKRLLTEAGYPNGVGLPPITLIYNTDENHKMIAEFVQRNLKENLRVGIDIENLEFMTLQKRQRLGDFVIARMGWIMDDPSDPSDMLKIFQCGQKNNHTAWCDKDFEKFFAAAQKVAAGPERNRLLAQAEQRVIDELPAVPFYHYRNVNMVRESVCGWHMSPTDSHFIHRMWLVKPGEDCTDGVHSVALH